MQRANLPQLLRAAFGLDAAKEGWHVEAAVVIEEFGGAPTPDPRVPIIPDWVLKEGVKRARTLKALVPWLLSETWLPVPGRDFELSHDAQRLLDMQVRFAGIFPIRSGRQFVEDATAGLRDS